MNMKQLSVIVICKEEVIARLEIKRKWLYKIKPGTKGTVMRSKYIESSTSCTCECILQNLLAILFI